MILIANVIVPWKAYWELQFQFCQHQKLFSSTSLVHIRPAQFILVDYDYAHFRELL